MVDINKPKQFSVGKKNKLVKCFSKTKVYPSFKESKIEKEHKLIKKKCISTNLSDLSHGKKQEFVIHGSHLLTSSPWRSSWKENGQMT